MVDWREQGDLSWLRSLAPDDIISLDIETTGLDMRHDEIIQVALVDGGCEEVVSSYVRPLRPHDWSRVSPLNGVESHTVESAPPIKELIESVSAVLARAELIVGYNLPFDLGFLAVEGVRCGRAICFDVMREFARVARRRSGCGGFKALELAECARYYGIAIRGHDAVEDACATCMCFQRMLWDDGFQYGWPGSVPFTEISSC